MIVFYRHCKIYVVLYLFEDSLLFRKGKLYFRISMTNGDESDAFVHETVIRPSIDLRVVYILSNLYGHM